MGDARYNTHLSRVKTSRNRAETIAELSDDQVIQALAASSRDERDPYLANVLATEAMNRIHVKHTIVENAGQGLLSLGPMLRITHVNPTCAQVLGYEPIELQGADFHGTMCKRGTGGHARAHCPTHLAVTQGAGRQIVDDRFRTRDGALLPVDWSVRPIMRDGEPNGAVVAFSDITERKLAEQRLQDERHIQETLINAQSQLGEGVVLSLNAKIQYVNEAFQRMTGRTADAFTDLQDITALVDPAARDRPGGQMLLDVIEGHATATRFDLPLLHKDGHRVEVEVAVQTSNEARARFTVMLVRDVTMRRALERSLRATEGAFRHGFDATTVPLLWFSLSGHCIRANPEATACLSTGSGDLVNTHANQIFGAESAAGLDIGFQRIRSGASTHESLRITTSGGGPATLSLNVVEDEEGRPAWVASAVHVP